MIVNFKFREIKILQFYYTKNYALETKLLFFAILKLKKVLSILLLVITTAYIMPLKYSVFTKDNISLTAAEKSCDETPEIKKDNTKELFNNSNEQYIVAYIKPASNNISPLLLSPFCGFVETPPPDFL